MKTKPRWYTVLLSCLVLLSLCSAIACRPEPPVIILFSATPSEINLDESTKLKWGVKGATSVTIDQGIGEVAATGSVDLSPAKTIAYTLTATNVGGAVSKSIVVYVNSPPLQSADTTPPVIEHILASSETETSAVITWVTNESSDSQIEYGKAVAYGLTATSDEMTTAHSITLSGLEPNTEYHYRVKSKDEAGNEVSSADNIFVTPQEKSPYSLELQSLEWGRRTAGTSSIPIHGTEYLFVKATLQNRSHATLRAVICTMNCWNGDTLVKYEVYVYRGTALPGFVFSLDIQTADDPTVDNVTLDLADSLGREIEVIKK
jgi:hypothetical protein